MFDEGFFIGGATVEEGSANVEEVTLSDNKVMYSPKINNIYINDSQSVFYSTENKNGEVYIDNDGLILARKKV